MSRCKGLGKYWWGLLVWVSHLLRIFYLEFFGKTFGDCDDNRISYFMLRNKHENAIKGLLYKKALWRTCLVCFTT